MTSKYIYTTYIKNLTAGDGFDIEKFILEVQKRECIWNVNSKSYNLKCVRNRETKKRAWEEIGMIFHCDWDELSDEDRQKKVDGLSKKWANIRKYYTDEVRRTTNSPPKKRQRTYHHLLTFLDDSVHKRRVQRIQEFRTVSNENVHIDSSSDSESGELFIVEDNDEPNQMPLEDEERVEAPVIYDIENNNNNNSDPFNDMRYAVNRYQLWEKTTYKRSYYENKTPNIGIMEKNPEILKLLTETRDPPPMNNNNNNHLNVSAVRPVEKSVLNGAVALGQSAAANETFLLSLLPEVMSLDVKQNVQFRLGVVHLLNDIKLRVTPNVDPDVFPDIN